LIGGREVFENFAPVGIFSGATAMAFVYDDEVEKIRREFAVESGAVGVFRDGLVGGKVKFAAEDDIAVFDFVAGVAKNGEGFVLGSSTRKLRSAR
jgi:hypothetical protein